MRKTVLSTIAVLAIFSSDGITQHARADGARIVHHPRKVHYAHHCVGLDHCGAPVGCPYLTPCYSIYGPYEPYGGPQYWSRYTYGGWFR
jgi:hypothetical protein